MDPLEFRRRLMKNSPKHLAVLEAAAKGIGWARPLPPACIAASPRSWALAAMSRRRPRFRSQTTARSRCIASWRATNPGHVVNPDQVAAQVEGSFVYGLSAAFHQECTVKDGRIVEKNFDTYPAMRIDEMPKVESILVPSGDFWGGVGEPTIAVAAPAVLNAIHAATGRRIRHLPMKNTT